MTKRRALWLLAGAVGCAFAAPIVFWGWAIWATSSEFHYGFSEMDWNGDGQVSFAEVLESPEFGARTVGSCREFFRLKDGLPVRRDCAST